MALLAGKEDKHGVVDRFEWKEATEQREGASFFFFYLSDTSLG